MSVLQPVFAEVLLYVKEQIRKVCLHMSNLSGQAPANWIALIVGRLM